MKGGIVVMIEDAVERRFVSVASLDNAIHIARRAVHEMEWRNELVLPKSCSARSRRRRRPICIVDPASVTY